MKKIITITLLAWSFQLTAQRAILVDSSFVSNRLGVFLVTRVISYSNGEGSTTTTVLGDTSQVLSRYVEGIVDKTKSMAADVETTTDYSRQIQEIIRQDPGIKALIGKSPLSAILSPVDSAFIDSTYRVRIGTETKSIKFLLAANGTFRYRVDTFPARNAFYLGGAMRLQNFQSTGTNVDLFQFKNGRWYNADKSIQLFLQTAGPQSRTVSAPPTQAKAASVPSSEAALYDGGVVGFEGKFYKYNATKKAWVVQTQKPKNLAKL